MTTKKKKIENMTYEEAVKRLEEIVNRLEDTDIPLEESLASFQEGVALSRYCREKLAEIEYKVEYLLKEEQQSLQNVECEETNNLQGDDGSETI